MAETADKTGDGGHFNAVIATPLPGGERLGIRMRAARLSAIDFLPPGTPLQPPCEAEVTNWVRQLERYFEYPISRFEIPLYTQGSVFRNRVWHELQQIGPGSTRRYGELARRLCSSARAVGGACRDNPVPIVVPCHRVVAACGTGGFMGQTSGTQLVIKRWLLRHEGAL